MYAPAQLALSPYDPPSYRDHYPPKALPERESGLDLGMLGEGPSLRMLEQTLSHVFMPMLVQMTGGGEADHRGAADAGGGGGTLMAPGTGQRHRELLGNMQKFLSQVSHALQQLNGDVALPVSVGWGLSDGLDLLGCSCMDASTWEDCLPPQLPPPHLLP